MIITIARIIEDRKEEITWGKLRIQNAVNTKQRDARYCGNLNDNRVVTVMQGEKN